MKMFIDTDFDVQFSQSDFYGEDDNNNNNLIDNLK